MCKHGDVVLININGRVCDIDRCIAPIVQALNDGEVPTVACCCGHNNRPGNIMLADGRELVIAQSFEVGRKIDKAFCDIHGVGGPEDSK